MWHFRWVQSELLTSLFFQDGMVFTWSPRMLKVDSKEGELGLVRQLDWLEVVKIGDEVTILEGGEFLSVAPDTNSIKSAWSNTWLADSKRLWISTWALLIFKGVTYFFSAGCAAHQVGTGRALSSMLLSGRTKKITVLGGSHRWSSSWALW